MRGDKGVGMHLTFGDQTCVLTGNSLFVYPVPQQTSVSRMLLYALCLMTNKDIIKKHRSICLKAFTTKHLVMTSVGPEPSL